MDLQDVLVDQIAQHERLDQHPAVASHGPPAEAEAVTGVLIGPRRLCITPSSVTCSIATILLMQPVCARQSGHHD